MERKIFTKEIKGIKVELPELDFIQEGEVMEVWDDLWAMLDVKKKESVSMVKYRRRLVDMLTLCGVVDASLFVKRVGEPEAIALVTDLLQFGKLSDEDKKKLSTESQ